MTLKNKIINIIGQIRIYSLVDLILFCLVICANTFQFLGIILLHISFLFYLESAHKHSYRLQIPKYIWIITGIIGTILYASLAVLGYIIASVLYAKKNNAPYSYFSPLSRGLQIYFLSAGIIGYTNPVSFLAMLVLTVRNLAGDLRDVIKDKNEDMITLPILLGFKNNYKQIHLVILFLTSFIWWYLLKISIIWLILVYLIQIITYNITPRKNIN
jgi:1,4-dihydroxy-2-naphthoate octaprenyltransferase